MTTYGVIFYTEDHGFSSDIDEFAFESFNEARKFFADYDIEHAWNTERRSQPALHCMKSKTFCAELWQDDECIDFKEYGYSDYMKED